MGNGSMAGNVTVVNRVNHYEAHLEVMYDEYRYIS